MFQWLIVSRLRRHRGVCEVYQQHLRNHLWGVKGDKFRIGLLFREEKKYVSEMKVQNTPFRVSIPKKREVLQGTTNIRVAEDICLEYLTVTY